MEDRIKHAIKQLEVAELDKEFDLMPITPKERVALLFERSLKDCVPDVFPYVLDAAKKLEADYMELEYLTYTLSIVFKKDPTRPPRKTNGNHKSDNDAQLVGEAANVGMNSQSEKQK